MWKNDTLSELLISYRMKTKITHIEGTEKTIRKPEKGYAHVDIDEIGKIVVGNWQMWKNCTLRIAN